MSSTISNALTKVKGYSRNQNLTDARGISVIDSASTFVLNHLGIPGYELEYSIDFFDDQMAYSLPAYVGDLISLRFDDKTLNKNSYFSFRQSEVLFEREGLVGLDTKLFGVSFASGAKQLYVLAKNSCASLLLDSMDTDNSTNWTASNDATTITDDTNVKKEGSGSMKFNIDTTLSGLDRATLTRTVTSTDLSTYVDKGVFRIWADLPSVTDLDSLSFNWKTDESNYYKATVTTQADGTAFEVGWNELNFVWLGATEVGSPSSNNITIYSIDMDYQAGFSSVNNVRFDYLRISVPDTLTLRYYTLYKGESSAGTKLYTFTATTDLFLFSSFDPTLEELIAIQASVILNPQIIVDDKSVRTLYKDFYTLLSRRYPRKRISNLLIEPKVARTDYN
jgi:hypothetical protein